MLFHLGFCGHGSTSGMWITDFSMSTTVVRFIGAAAWHDAAYITEQYTDQKE
jgi:hypothetical protein